jgi:hypothetical protein
LQRQIHAERRRIRRNDGSFNPSKLGAQMANKQALIASSTMAGEWNNAAARNNGLGVQLSN